MFCFTNQHAVQHNRIIKYELSTGEIGKAQYKQNYLAAGDIIIKLQLAFNCDDNLVLLHHSIMESAN